MHQKSRLRRHAHGLPGSVGQHLRRLAEWAVASSLTAAVGCADAASRPDADPGARPPAAGGGAVAPASWRTLACGDLLLATNPVSATRKLDYLGVYHRAPSSTALITDWGNACETASDRASCLDSLQRLSARSEETCAAEPGKPPAPYCNPFALLTTGDTVERQDDAGALARWLAPIDTESEAVLIAILHGLRLSCTTENFGREAGTFVQRSALGYNVRSEWSVCGGTIGRQALEVREDGSSAGWVLNEVMSSGCSIGRRPEGLTVTQPPRGCEPLGAFFAEIARLEAASVYAFERLDRELGQLGAADEQRAAARRSANDERLHTRLTAWLAERYGAGVPAPQLVAPRACRSALSIALENATEGCVRETFGALVAAHQAALARDPALALIMRQVAADEARHAELAWQVAGWLEPQLSRRERTWVDAARSQTLREIEREIGNEGLSDAARDHIGWPSAATSHALLQRMAGTLGLS